MVRQSVGCDVEIGDNSGIGYNAHILYNTKKAMML